MKENLNTILLALILLGVGVNTYMLADKKDDNVSSASAAPTAGAGHFPGDGHDHGETSTINNPISTDPAAQAPTAPAGPTTSIQFTTNTHDFGTIKQDTKNEHVFKFKNTGSEPLLIQNAQGSCGCTVPQYPKEPIPPGGTGEIIVEYSPGKQQGLQNKTVTITANTNPPQTLLNISANVITE